MRLNYSRLSCLLSYRYLEKHTLLMYGIFRSIWYMNEWMNECSLSWSSNFVPNGWLQILLVPDACWISSETILALSQNSGVVKCSDSRHLLVHALHHLVHSCSLLSCILLTFVHPVVPCFTFPTSHSIVLCISNKCAFQNTVYMLILYSLLLIV